MSTTYTKKDANLDYAQWSHKCWVRLYYPADLEAAEKLPLIISMHGQGELGNTEADLAKLEAANGSIPQHVSAGQLSAYRFIIAAPQAPTAQGWSFEQPQIAYLLPQILTLFPDQVDTTKIGVTGYSSGGEGAFSCLCADPAFAATLSCIAPISSAGLSATQIGQLAPNALSSKMSIRLMCGTSDSFYPPNQSYYQTLHNGGVTNVQFDTIQGGGHWSTQAYDPAHLWVDGKNFYDWFAAQVCGGGSVITPPDPTPIPDPITSATFTMTAPAGTDLTGTVVEIVSKDSSGNVISTQTVTI